MNGTDRRLKALTNLVPRFSLGTRGVDTVKVLLNLSFRLYQCHSVIDREQALLEIQTAHNSS